jgi:predicted enzyme involved in methoxymalonyl-ACP biosynthesis
MNEVAIVHESTIFDKRRARFMNESNTIQFRALKISSTTKKENKRSSCRSLKAKMKNLFLRYRVYVDFNSDKEHRQKAFAIAQLIEKNRKFIIDSNSNREN